MISIEKIPYYRDFGNDFPKETKEERTTSDRVIRITQAALPIFSMHRPFQVIVAFAGNSLRTITSILESIEAPTFITVAKTVTAVVAFLLTFTVPVLGIMATTAEDIAIYLGSLYEAAQTEDYKKALESCAQMIIGVLYLALFFSPGIELLVIGLSVQILMGFYRGVEEFKKGYFIEGSAHFLLAALRMQQLHSCMQMEKKTILQALPPNVQEAREIKAILEDSRLYERLKGEMIEKIERTEGGYLITTPTDGFFVQVHYLPNKIIGPAKFEIIFQPETCHTCLN